MSAPSGSAPMRSSSSSELDIATLPEFERAVTRMRAQGLERMVIDLRRLAFLDSMSIELLLRLHGELTAAARASWSSEARAPSTASSI